MGTPIAALELWDVQYRREVHDSLVDLHQSSISDIHAKNYGQARTHLIMLVEMIWELQRRYPSLRLSLHAGISPLVYVVDDGYDANNNNEGDLEMFPHPLTPIFWATMFQLEFVALYNLALASHMYAMENVTSRLSLLVNAKEMWEALYSVRISEQYQIQPIHTLAILTNLANIHLVLGDREAANSCFQDTLALLAIPSLRQRSTPFSSVFLANAQYVLSTFRTAPAA